MYVNNRLYTHNVEQLTLTTALKLKRMYAPYIIANSVYATK